MGHLQPSCAAPTDGSLSPDSFRARRMLLTAESGHNRTHAVRQISYSITASALASSEKMLWGGGGEIVSIVADVYRWSPPMHTPNDLNQSRIVLKQDSTLIAVIEMSLSSWLVAGVVPGVERQPLKKLAVDESALLKLLNRWREWRFLMFQKDSALAQWFRARTENARGTRKTMIVALARKLLIALWRLVREGVVPDGIVLRPRNERRSLKTPDSFGQSVRS